MGPTADALADRLWAALRASPRSGPVVELAVGNRPDVAAALAARGADVLATDRCDRACPAGVTFVVDDLTDPQDTRFGDAALFYARNLPAELQRPALSLADGVGAPLYFTTLGAEEPVIPVSRDQLTAAGVRETLYRATASAP